MTKIQDTFKDNDRYDRYSSKLITREAVTKTTNKKILKLIHNNIDTSDNRCFSFSL